MVDCCVEGRDKIVIGPVEDITFKGESPAKFEGRVDTGATSSSIDAKIVADLKLGPVLSVRKVRNAHGETLRPVVEAKFVIRGKTLTANFTVADRSKMKYKVLIGRNILKEGFLIDVTK